jgi:hypothetical protein
MVRTPGLLGTRGTKTDELAPVTRSRVMTPPALPSPERSTSHCDRPRSPCGDADRRSGEVAFDSDRKPERRPHIRSGRFDHEAGDARVGDNRGHPEYGQVRGSLIGARGLADERRGQSRDGAGEGRCGASQNGEGRHAPSMRRKDQTDVTPASGTRGAAGSRGPRARGRGRYLRLESGSPILLRSARKRESSCIASKGCMYGRPSRVADLSA